MNQVHLMSSSDAFRLQIIEKVIEEAGGERDPNKSPEYFELLSLLIFRGSNSKNPLFKKTSCLGCTEASKTILKTIIVK